MVVICVSAVSFRARRFEELQEVRCRVTELEMNRMPFPFRRTKKPLVCSHGTEGLSQPVGFGACREQLAEILFAGRRVVKRLAAESFAGVATIGNQSATANPSCAAKEGRLGVSPVFTDPKAVRRGFNL